LKKALVPIRTAPTHNHGDAAADEIGCERRQLTKLVLRPVVFDRHILALDIAGFLEAQEKRNGDALVDIKWVKEPDHRQPRLLCPRRQRPRRRAPKPRDELSAFIE
jgi:hypothetical protein